MILAEFTKENGNKTKDMEMGTKIIRTEIFIRENI
jgi:hypothetical protein